MPKGKYKTYRYPGVRPWKKPGTYRVDYIDHNGLRHQKTFHGTESDAVKFRRAILAKVDRIKAGLEAPPEEAVSIPTLDELWQSFEEDRLLKINAGSMSERTLERCRNSYQALMEYQSTIGDTVITEIQPSEFESYKAYRRELGFSPEGINVDLRKLKTLFNFAIKRGYLRVSPLAEVAQVSYPKADVRFLDEDELQTLNVVLEGIDPADEFQRDARDLTLFYLFTGARLSEVLYPTFDWSCDRQNAISFPRTKFSKSRAIPKTDRLEEILRGRRDIPGGPFHHSKDQVYKRIKWVFEQAGIRDASPHTLRKTAGAWYYMATRDIFATAKFLGHSTVRVTEEHYAGLIQSLQIDYARQFESMLGGRLQLGNNFKTKQDWSGVVSVSGESDDPRRETGEKESGRCRTRTCDLRLVRAAL